MHCSYTAASQGSTRMQVMQVNVHVQSMSTVPLALHDTEGITCSLIRLSAVIVQWHIPRDSHCAAGCESVGCNNCTVFIQ